MKELTLIEQEAVSGGGFLGDLRMHLSMKLAEWTFDKICEGKVDYSGLAAEQGSKYNMLGA